MILKSVIRDIRRAMCEDADTDPLVWTNARFIKWVQTIDLAVSQAHLHMEK